MAILQIIALGFFLIIIKSFINKSKLVSFLLALIFTIQLSSLIVTGDIADYKFYEHFSFNDIWSVKDFFAIQGIIIGLSLLFVTIIIHFLSFKWREKKINLATSLVILILTSSFLMINGGIINNFYKTFKLKLADTSGTFNEALTKLNIDEKDYTFPKDIEAIKGKNIIVLSLESFEKAYFNDKLKHLTPNLRELAKNYSFYTVEQCPGAGWTSGSIYTTMTGVPAFFGMNGNRIFQNTNDIKLTTLPKTLKKAGYDIEYLIGKKEHSGVNDMLLSLGFKVRSEKDFDTTYSKVPWGLNDKDLFIEIKKSLLKKKKAKKPFALFASTISTHFPDGMYDESMEKILPPQKSKLEFMASAVDYFVGDLMKFLKKEKMLSNTVFYIIPDHLLMGNKSRVLKDFDERKLYVLTNANLNLDEGKKLYQIDLPKIILEGAGIKHNAKFLTDYIKQKDKIHFLKENLVNLKRLNMSSLKIINGLDGFEIEFNSPTRLTIKNSENINLYTNDNFNLNSIYRIDFDKWMRIASVEVVKYKDELKDNKSTSLILSVSKGFLYVQLKKGEFFGIAKKGKNTIIFTKEDLNTINELSKLAQSNLKNELVSDGDKESELIEIESYSWNAKKRSFFRLNDKSEKLTRGLTVVKIMNKSKYTTKTFDTHGSLENTREFVKYVKNLKNSNEFFLVIGHDALGTYFQEFSKELSEMGLQKLGSIKKPRKAYVFINNHGNLTEEMDDFSIIKKLLIKDYLDKKENTNQLKN